MAAWCTRTGAERRLWTLTASLLLGRWPGRSPPPLIPLPEPESRRAGRVPVPPTALPPSLPATATAAASGAERALPWISPPSSSPYLPPLRIPSPDLIADGQAAGQQRASVAPDGIGRLDAVRRRDEGAFSHRSRARNTSRQPLTVRRGTVPGAGAGAGCVGYEGSRRTALIASLAASRRLGGWRWPHFPEAARRALWRGRMGAERKLRVLTTALLLGGWRWPPDTSNEGRTVFHHVRARVVVEQDQHPGANPSLRQASARAWLRKTGGRICSTGTSVCACSHSIRRGRRR
ncbi:hypothetical protein SETIT_9G556500v2 [Setaria italica]|uniref:Uncharacterized protein n=1 Tax=Setaria italica TaxID=4555 RepID=A0A368SWK0_SETIT|nr:hypothetical protein SETIT_9G556500v2 [Setaria italica]